MFLEDGWRLLEIMNVCHNAKIFTKKWENLHIFSKNVCSFVNTCI